MMPLFVMTIGSHFFRLNRINQQARPCVTSFSNQYAIYERKYAYGQSYQVKSRVFATATEDRQEIRYHINQLPAFEQHLKLHGIEDRQFERRLLPVKHGRKVELKIKKGWVDRNDAVIDQPAAIAFLTKDSTPERPLASRLLQEGTGKGKSYCWMRAASEIGELPILVMRPSYIKKWIIDLEKTYEIKRSEIMTVEGSSQLIKLLNMADTLDDFKIILLSNKTLQNWLLQYEKLRDGVLELGYPCLPEEMYQRLRVGYRGKDEAHLDFHLNYKIDTYTNIAKAGDMSATMISDDPQIGRIMTMIYPQHARHGDPNSEKHVNAVGLLFQVKRVDEFLKQVTIRTGMYQHNEFELLVLKRKETQDAYFKLIRTQIEQYYLEEDFYKTSDKCLIYVYGVYFAEVLVEHLQKIYGDMDVRRYVENDPYSNLMDAQICVTNLGKAGANVDIKGLSTAICTVAVKSSTSNIQGFGRLRPLPDGRPARFIWFTCVDIPKHIDYHEGKMTLLRSRAETLRTSKYSTPI